MKAYTLKEVAKKINVTPGTIRQWEKDLTGYLEIPRSKQGARIYTENEIEMLVEIKTLYSQKLTKDMVRQRVKAKTSPAVQKSVEIEEIPHVPEASLEVISEPPAAAPAEMSTDRVNNANVFFEAMETYKRNFIDEVKQEITQVIRHEVIDEVKKEISNGNLRTVKTLSNSIYKSTENTKLELQGLTESVEKASEVTSGKLQSISNRLKNVTKETSNHISALSRQFAETSQEMVRYTEITRQDLAALSDTISGDYEAYKAENNQFRQEIQQREVAFQQMLSNFRDVAAAKEKKWWKFWD